MAFIPDVAIKEGSEVSALARCLYYVYCLHLESGLSIVDNAVAMTESAIERRTFFDKRKELELKGWIAIEGKAVRCLKGFTPGSPSPEKPKADPEQDPAPIGTANHPSAADAKIFDSFQDSTEPEMQSADAPFKSAPLALVPSPPQNDPPAPAEFVEVQGDAKETEEFEPNPIEDLYCKIFGLILPEYWLGRFTNECADLLTLEEVWRIWEGKAWKADNFPAQLDRYHRLQADKDALKADLNIGASASHQRPVAPTKKAAPRFDESPPTLDEARPKPPTSENIRDMLVLARLCRVDPISGTPGKYADWEELCFTEAVKYLPNIFEMSEEAFRSVIEKTVFMPKAA